MQLMLRCVLKITLKKVKVTNILQEMPPRQIRKTHKVKSVNDIICPFEKIVFAQDVCLLAWIFMICLTQGFASFRLFLKVLIDLFWLHFGILSTNSTTMIKCLGGWFSKRRKIKERWGDWIVCFRLKDSLTKLMMHKWAVYANKQLGCNFLCAQPFTFGCQLARTNKGPCRVGKLFSNNLTSPKIQKSKWYHLPIWKNPLFDKWIFKGLNDIIWTFGPSIFLKVLFECYFDALKPVLMTLRLKRCWMFVYICGAENLQTQNFDFIRGLCRKSNASQLSFDQECHQTCVLEGIWRRPNTTQLLEGSKRRPCQILDSCKRFKMCCFVAKGWANMHSWGFSVRT